MTLCSKLMCLLAGIHACVLDMVAYLSEEDNILTISCGRDYFLTSIILSYCSVLSIRHLKNHNVIVKLLRYAI